MRLRLDWQKKARVIFAGFILVLGSILVVLAIREAEREKLTRENEVRAEQQRYAFLFREEVDSIFSDIEERIAEDFKESRIRPDANSITESCRLIAGRDNLIKDIFFSVNKQPAVFPLDKHDLPEPDNQRRITDPLINLETHSLFRAAESAELAAINLPLALKSYHQLETVVSDSAAKALLMNRLARCYLKAGRLPEALNTYETIIIDYSHELSSAGIPLGIIAYSQIGVIYRNAGDGLKCAKNIIEFYEALLGTEWNLTLSQFSYYQNKIKDMYHSYASNSAGEQNHTDFQTQWEILEKRADHKFAAMHSKEDLKTRVMPMIQARMAAVDNPGFQFSRFSERSEYDRILVCAAAFRKDFILGFQIDTSVLLEERIPSLLKRLPISQNWMLQILDESGKILSGGMDTNQNNPDKQAVVSLNFNQNFPPWEIRINPRDPDSISQHFDRRRNFYVLTVSLVTAALFLGGFLAIRSTAREIELAKLKSEFVATVSHEFRTPLMSIRYLSEMLQGDKVKSRDKQIQYYGKINRESERLSRLIENILDFSTIEAGMKEYRFEDTAIEELVKDVANQYREYLVKKTISLEVEISDDLPVISVDRDAVSRALFNLLDNSLKYSGQEKKIYLRASTETDFVKLEVRDEGIGIKKEDVNMVFEKFYRAHDKGHSHIKGSGIGLTVVAHIAEAHGGEVHLDSEVGMGTTVTFKLPIKKREGTDE